MKLLLHKRLEIVPSPFDDLKLIFVFVIDAAASHHTFFPTLASVARFGLFTALLLAKEALAVSCLAL